MGNYRTKIVSLALAGPLRLVIPDIWQRVVCRGRHGNCHGR